MALELCGDASGEVYLEDVAFGDVVFAFLDVF